MPQSAKSQLSESKISNARVNFVPRPHGRHGFGDTELDTGLAVFFFFLWGTGGQETTPEDLKTRKFQTPSVFSCWACIVVSNPYTLVKFFSCPACLGTDLLDMRHSRMQCLRISAVTSVTLAEAAATNHSFLAFFSFLT